MLLFSHLWWKIFCLRLSFLFYKDNWSLSKSFLILDKIYQRIAVEYSQGCSVHRVQIFSKWHVNLYRVGDTISQRARTFINSICFTERIFFCERVLSFNGNEVNFFTFFFSIWYASVFSDIFYISNRFFVLFIAEVYLNSEEEFNGIFFSFLLFFQNYWWCYFYQNLL